MDGVIRNVAGAQNPVAVLPDRGSTSAFTLAYSPGDKILAVGDSDGNTYLWDVATHKLIATLPVPSQRRLPGAADSVRENGARCSSLSAPPRWPAPRECS
jgi:WD40 repeat protein